MICFFLELFRVRVCHHPNPAWRGARRPRLHCNILLERHYLWMQVKMGDFTSVLSGLACRDSLYSEHSLFPSLSLFVRGFASHLTFFLSFLFFFSFRCHRGHGEVRMSRGGWVDEWTELALFSVGVALPLGTRRCVIRACVSQNLVLFILILTGQSRHTELLLIVASTSFQCFTCRMSQKERNTQILD